jgi:hypothetical protein
VAEPGGRDRRHLRPVEGGKAPGPLDKPRRRRGATRPGAVPVQGGEQDAGHGDKGDGGQLGGRRRGALGGRAAAIARIPDAVWSPVVVAVLCAAAGLIGLAVGQPWLFASLGPTAFLQAHQARSRASGFYNTVVGHTVGIAVGYAMVALFSLGPATAVFATYDLTASRVWASVLAVGLTMLIQIPLKAYHPPAAATTLLITLGAFRRQWSDVIALFAGVLIVAVLGEGFRRLRERGMPEQRRDQKRAA